MHNHKSDLPLQEIDVLPGKISVLMTDDPRNEVAVILPAVQKFNQSGNSNLPDLSVGSLTNDTPTFIQPEVYENEYSRLLRKFKRFGSSYTYLSHLAQLRQLVGDLDGAECYLKTALQKNHASFLQVDLSALLIERNNDKGAQQILHRCDTSKDLRANLRLAYISVRQSQVEEAERYVNRALHIDNTNYDAQLFSGTIHLYRMRWEQAVRSFRAAAETRDDSSVLFTNLAAAYWGLGEEEKTVKSLHRAVLLDPLNETAVLFLADVMFSRGTPEQCIASLEVILSYKQDKPELWERAARAYYESGTGGSRDKSRLRIGDITQAARFLGVLGQWVHRDSCATATLGLYHLKMGRADRAKALYEESIKLETDSISKIRIRQRMDIELGRFYLEQGDKKRGRKHLEQARKKPGGHDYAVEESQKLLMSLGSS